MNLQDHYWSKFGIIYTLFYLYDQVLIGIRVSELQTLKASIGSILAAFLEGPILAKADMITA